MDGWTGEGRGRGRGRAGEGEGRASGAELLMTADGRAGTWRKGQADRGQAAAVRCAPATADPRGWEETTGAGGPSRAVSLSQRPGADAAQAGSDGP